MPHNVPRRFANLSKIINFSKTQNIKQVKNNTYLSRLVNYTAI
jgi:hypothetical protein